MTDKEGTLQMQPWGRWAVCRPGRDPVEVKNGGAFRVEVPAIAYRAAHYQDRRAAGPTCAGRMGPTTPTTRPAPVHTLPVKAVA